MKSNLKCSDLPTMMIVCAMFGIMQKWRIYFEILKTFFILQNDELKLPRMKKKERYKMRVILKTNRKVSKIQKTNKKQKHQTIMKMKNPLKTFQNKISI
jgi:uncharacterized protein YdaU (DUF1376 family)